MILARRNRVLLAGLALAFGVVVVETRKVATSREQTARLQAETFRIEVEAAKRRSTRDDLGREAETAERQLAEIPPPSRLSADAAREAAVGDWFARLRRLRRGLVGQPDLAIPEMTLLADADWLFIAKTMPLDTEDDLRRAAGQLRTRAKLYFAPQLSAAIRRHPTALYNAAPFDILTLGPFFDKPVAPAILRRYESVSLPKPDIENGGGVVLGVRERSPVDPLLDMRLEIVNGGSVSTGAPVAWVPDFQRRAAQARVRYHAANPYDPFPPNTAKMVSYFDPPLPAEVIQQIAADEAAGR